MGAGPDNGERQQSASDNVSDHSTIGADPEHDRVKQKHYNVLLVRHDKFQAMAVLSRPIQTLILGYTVIHCAYSGGRW